jgi:hypothetical protein
MFSVQHMYRSAQLHVARSRSGILAHLRTFCRSRNTEQFSNILQDNILSCNWLLKHRQAEVFPLARLLSNLYASSQRDSNTRFLSSFFYQKASSSPSFTVWSHSEYVLELLVDWRQQLKVTNLVLFLSLFQRWICGGVSSSLIQCRGAVKEYWAIPKGKATCRRYWKMTKTSSEESLANSHKNKKITPSVQHEVLQY